MHARTRTIPHGLRAERDPRRARGLDSWCQLTTPGRLPDDPGMERSVPGQPHGSRHIVDWDATTYDRIADPMTRWGGQVLERLALRGDEHVLDAGCGTGRVTAQLLERLPRGHVTALDASPSMIATCRDRLASWDDRVSFVVADLLEPLPVTSAFDAVFSTATFHWVPDHDRLFWNLHAALTPGGQLVAQCGGAGNIARVLAAADAVGGQELATTAESSRNFATPEATQRRLTDAGFVDVETWLNPEPTALARGGPLEEYLATVILRVHLAQLPEAQRAPFVTAVAAALEEPVIDYVRLNIVARRGPN